MKRRTAFILAVMFGFGVQAQAAEAWPTQPIRLVVPFAAGGVTDIVARLLAKSMGESLKTPVVVDNVGGANGGIGAVAVARARPDGYTLMMGTPATLAANMVLVRNRQYDAEQDFAPLATVVTLPNVLIVRNDLPASSVAELIALMKKEPGKLSFGVNGIGANGHLTTELFKAKSGTEAVAIPYKGAAPMLMDLIAGRTDFTIDQATSAMAYIRAKQLRVLAVTSAQRSPFLSEVPTLSESGIKDFNSSSWLALVAPKGTPAPVIAILNAEINKAVRDPAFIASLAQYFASPAGGSPEDLRRLMKEEIERVKFIVEYAHIPMND